jgi:hypothetical protein
MKNFTYIIYTISLLSIVFFAITTHALEDVKDKRYEIPEGGFINNFTAEELDTYLNKLEKAVKNDAADEIAQLVSYPLLFNSTQNHIKIKDKSEFKQMYPKIFNDTVKKAAIEGKVSEVGYRGFMFGDGMIWFDPKNGIFTINDPTK